MSTTEATPAIRRFLGLQAFLFKGLLVWLLVVEVGVRFTPIGRPTAAVNAETVASIPHPYFAFAPRPDQVLGEGAVHHDTLGFRGASRDLAKPPGVRRVVCLGGAATYGQGSSSDATTWPARLEVHLAARGAGAVEVWNAGFPGWSTFENTTSLAFRVLELDPDEVIVYAGVEDMRAALYGDPVRDNTHYRAVWPVFRTSPLEPHLERSVTYRLLCRAFFDSAAPLDAPDTLTVLGLDPEDPDPYGPEPASPRGLENFRRNLRTIVGIAQEHGAGVTLVTQGFDAEKALDVPSGPAQVSTLAAMAAILAETAEALGAKFVDAAPLLDEAARRGEDVFSTTDLLTDAGADTLARIVEAGTR